GEQRRRSRANALVHRAGEAAVLAQLEQAHVRELHPQELLGAVARAVVDDDRLEAVVGLLAQRAEALLEKMLPVPRRDHDSHLRGRHREGTRRSTRSWTGFPFAPDGSKRSSSKP